MTESARQNSAPPKIIGEIVAAGKAAFDPSEAPQVRDPAFQAYQKLIASTELFDKAEYTAPMAEGPIVARSYPPASEA
ncbi:hypothetical protein E4U21_004360 [Claviceps maximensis]|nr:hypothetical protein E4U21_004360 [Claviceps maximensis]